MKSKLKSYVVCTTSFVFGFILSQCKVIEPSATPSPSDITDQASCVTACSNLQKLGCQEANPIQEGTTCNTAVECLGPDGGHDQYQTCVSGKCVVTCVDFCTSTENQGVWLDPVCVSQITSCSQISTCPVASTGTSCTGSSCQVAPSHGKR